VDSNGNVTTNSSRVHVTGTNTITFNSGILKPVNFDSGSYDWSYNNGRAWIYAGATSVAQLISAGTGTDDFGAGESVMRWPGVNNKNWTNIFVDSNGNVATNSSRVHVTGTNTIIFEEGLLEPIAFDPGSYIGQYNNGRAWVTTGSSTAHLVPAGTGTDDKGDGSYQFLLSTGGSGVFGVQADPCSILPPDGLDISGFHFSISCEDITPPDADDDGIPDEHDNCPNTPNTDQVDQDGDGVGDVCDADLDGDGVNNDVDNCPAFANADQADLDGDGIGDVCDNDVDGDSVNDEADNCPLTPNTDQADGDSDGLGNACDPDDDNDTIPDEVDNCPNNSNADQADTDGDGEGDVCDGDVDGDGVGNTADQCPTTPAGSAVTIEGCSGAQFIELQCPADSFPNHGRFVSCVAHTAKELVDIGLITKKEKARFVSQAAKK